MRPNPLLRGLWVSMALSALVGAVCGVVFGKADADDAVVAQDVSDAHDAPEEACNEAIPEEVLRAVSEMAGPDEVQDPPDEDTPHTSEAERPAGWIANSTTDVIETPIPSAWLRRGGRCVRNRGRRVCDGPRHAPRPRGEPAALAQRLGIGTRNTASKVLLQPPDDTWVSAVLGHESTTLLWPVPEGRLWRGYGYVRQGRARRKLHKGLDIGAAAGSQIRSVNDGLVIYANNEVRGYGNLMMILHPDGSVAFYAHCRRLFLFPGQRVRRGQVLGEVGHTGIASGDHLHFELRVRGRARDPLRRMVGRGDVEPTGADT